VRHVEHVMGMAVSFDTGPDTPPAAVTDAVALLHDIDATFSTYKPESEISRLGRGEISIDDCRLEVREVLELCNWLHEETDGYFDTQLPDGRGGTRLDPSGLVKGWAVEEAATVMEAAGADWFWINAGGDIVARSGSARTWRVGIRHPREADKVAAVIEVADLAIATSGTYERGEHIVDPHSGRPPEGLASVTVIGESLTYVDAFATTAFAMGEAGASWAASRKGYGVFAITNDDRVLVSDAFERYRVA
jgi:thiamine biosynthesis lipoprotein